MLQLLKRLWQSERNPLAWDIVCIVGGNTNLSSHGTSYRHRYTKRLVFVPRFPRLQKEGGE